MVVEGFLRWVHGATVAERASAAAILAYSYIAGDLPLDERCAADAAMTLLLDDPSAKVRKALAEALSTSHVAPPQIIATLAADQPEVAAIVIARSPLLTDDDLIDRVAYGHPAIQKLIADRPNISMNVAAALAELGDAEACRTLLVNSGAKIAAVSFNRLTERFGDDAAMRETLIADPRLPACCRLTLVSCVSAALGQSALVRAVIGEARAARLLRDACVRATLTAVETTDAGEFPALVEHMRLQGALTTSFLVRAVAHGKVDFLGAALAALSGQAEHRVAALLSNGYDHALRALFGRAGIVARAHDVMLAALKVWREVARGKRSAGPQEVSWLMLKALGPEDGDLSALLKSIHLDALRANARAIATAALAAPEPVADASLIEALSEDAPVAFDLPALEAETRELAAA